MNPFKGNVEICSGIVAYDFSLDVLYYLCCITEGELTCKSFVLKYHWSEVEASHIYAFWKNIHMEEKDKIWQE